MSSKQQPATSGGTPEHYQMRNKTAAFTIEDPSKPPPSHSQSSPVTNNNGAN
ncbi:hypothetical protein SCLCIDRAFT_1217010 [Scleroderma citrinum Foug A]|uniref:Uncharacterized protein n=1 Tax=Scleroderma citrinum Foug A TaxID=1036808 RepID=A0A0C3DVL9_9AGAM|nr:hypothetical protein SCLCIDRAFT_1217010 [Scleroderma citrinum Foug A]